MTNQFFVIIRFEVTDRIVPDTRPAEENADPIAEPDQGAIEIDDNVSEHVEKEEANLVENVNNREVDIPETGSQSEEVESATVTVEEPRQAETNERFETELEDDPSKVPSGMNSNVRNQTAHHVGVNVDVLCYLL